MGGRAGLGREPHERTTVHYFGAVASERGANIGIRRIRSKGVIPFHPLADIFPLVEGEEFEQLVASVKASDGPHEPIIIHQNMILDGRNRARACEAAGIEATYAPLPAGIDPVAFVIDKSAAPASE